jgi:PAS domain S-box-containing protein
MLVQSVVDYAIFMLEPSGHVASWNAGAERIKGYRAHEIIGEHFSRFYTEHDRADHVPQRALETAARNGRYEAEGLRVRKDGNTFWASVVIDVVRDDDGAVIGFAKVTRDLTERRAAEERLRQAQKMEVVGQLTRGIAHDFNNLLQVILGNLDALRRSDLLSSGEAAERDRCDRYLDRAIGGASRAASLTERLLAFSRSQPLDVRRIDANKLVAGVANMLGATLGESITVATVLPGDAWPVATDANQLENALLNLAVNARDAMPDGGTVTLSTANARFERGTTLGSDEVEPGDYVMMAVADTGTGMTPEVAARAFEPFFTTKEIGQGSGLGLSQVYGFIKQSVGHAVLDSTPDRGTTVRLYLPRFVGERNETIAAPQREAPSAAAGEVILVVEDEIEVRTNTTEMLTELGYQVIEAPDGATALTLLAEHPEASMVFTDVGLPGGISGRDLAARARQRRPELKVLLTTGYAGSVRGAPAGVPVLTKPFSFVALAEKLREVLAS